MMRHLRNLLILTIAILGFTFTNADAQSFSKNGKTSVRTIENKVFKEIIKLPYYGIFDNIKFQVDGNTVYLLGKVTRPTTKSSAERLVGKIDGVDNVVNNIEILPLSRFDDSIRLRTLRTLQDRGGFYRHFAGANPSVRIIVDNGNLSLEGYVATRGDFNLMNVLARSVSGVFNVQNNLIIEKELVR